jgi:hypothetical protein
MKKVVIAGVGLLLLAVSVRGGPVPGPLPPPEKPALQITSPVGGEKWWHDISHDITWKAAHGLAGTVELVLLRHGALLGVIAHGIPATQGSYSWISSQYIGGVAPTGGGYKITIRSEKSGVATLHAPSPPSTTTPGTFDLYVLAVTSPNGKEVWRRGTAHAVTWHQEDMSGTVNVTLWRNGAYLAHIARDVPATAGTFSWQVGTVLPGPPAPGSVVPGRRYKVCVQSTDIAYRGFDCSNQSFSVR